MHKLIQNVFKSVEVYLAPTTKALRLFIVAVALVSAFVIALGAPVADASPTYSEQDAIALASQHWAFADLVTREGWSAAAYDTHNTYGIWRVQFWNEYGEDAGWADVNLERARVYSWDAYYDSTPAQDNSAQEVIEQFVRSHPDILEIMPEVGDAESRYMYIDYDPWADYWGVYVDAGQDSLWLAVTFDGKHPGSLDNPNLHGIYFPNVVSYGEWVEASKAEAVSLAFQQEEISAIVRGYEGWQTAVEMVTSDIWAVSFNDGEQTLAQATVDMLAQSVMEFTIFTP